MAVSSFFINGAMQGMKGFHPPKQASVTHWYKAATAQFDEAPCWRTVDMGKARISADTISYDGTMTDPLNPGNIVPWQVIIARKRHLR